jgi:hypothetical protein
VKASQPPVTILTSGVGLGLYIPALLIERRLSSRGFDVDVEVLEGHYTPAYQRTHLAHRDAHHANFALAQLAHRMARDVEHCFDQDRLRTLLERWLAQGRRNFIVWAGFWLPVIERYRRMIGGYDLDVHHCRIDAVISASFKVHPDLDAAGEEVWLWNWARREIEHEIPVAGVAPIPFDARDDRLVVHGGGWGIGTYRTTIPELARTSYSLDVVIHDASEARPRKRGDRAFMLDPAWHPWPSEPGARLAFPRMIEMNDEAAIRYRHNDDYHPMHDVIRASKAIVSKPGGCTLIDSLAAHAPVVLLEPYGYAEEANARIWEHLGFGIRFAAWRETGYNPAVLARLSANIAARAPGIDYPLAYVNRLIEYCV